MKTLEELKREYLNISIPENLDTVVKRSFKRKTKINKSFRGLYKFSLGVAACIAGFVVLVNSSPAFAKTMSTIPMVSKIVKVVTIREYNFNQDNYSAQIKVPNIKGLENKELESSLNQKYVNENKRLYDQFMSQIKDLKINGYDEAHLGIDSGYSIMTDNERILSIKRYTLTIAGSSDTKLKYDTIDKQDQVLITLPSLFKDYSYVDIISKNIIEQMKEQMKTQDGMIFWLEDQSEYKIESFKKISKEQNFYINKNNELVISFDKYEVGPGAIGTPEFTIPTNIISDILVGNDYIK